MSASSEVRSDNGGSGGSSGKKRDSSSAFGGASRAGSSGGGSAGARSGKGKGPAKKRPGGGVSHGQLPPDPLHGPSTCAHSSFLQHGSALLDVARPDDNNPNRTYFLLARAKAFFQKGRVLPHVDRKTGRIDRTRAMYYFDYVAFLRSALAAIGLSKDQATLFAGHSAQVMQRRPRRIAYTKKTFNTWLEWCRLPGWCDEIGRSYYWWERASIGDGALHGTDSRAPFSSAARG
jgi:hypothetical protein